MSPQKKSQPGLRLVLLVLVLALAVAVYFRWRNRRIVLEKPGIAIDDPKVIKAIQENTTKLLVVGIDGATWEIITSLIGQGKLPNLRMIIEQGSHGKMISESPTISPSIWTTFATGLPRKTHNIDNFTFKPINSYEPQSMDSRVRAAPALWEILSRFKKKVAVVNWNAARPAEPINGIFIADGANPNNLGAEYIYPPEFAARLKGMALPRSEWFEINFSRWDHALLPKAYEEDAFVAGAAIEILKNEQPDLMMIYFRNIDMVSHLFWKYRYPVGAEYQFTVSAPDQERFWDIIEAYYQMVDDLLGKLLAAGPGYQVMIISDHGQGATFQPKNVFLEINKLLHEIGYLEYVIPACPDVLGRMYRDGLINSSSPEKDIFFDCELLQQSKFENSRAPAEFLIAKQRLNQDKLAQANPDLEKLFKALSNPQLASRIDFKDTTIYNLDDFHKDERGIFLNLKGRDPDGVVAQKDLELFGNNAIRALSDLQNENGVKLFKTIKPNPDKPKPLVNGPVDPPDLLVQFNPEALNGRWIYRNKRDKNPIFISSILWSYRDVSGDHTPEGVIIISRPEAHKVKQISAQIYDVAPTILYMFDAPLAKDMPGKILSEAFAEKQMPVKYVDSYIGKIKIPVKYQKQSMSAEELERLRAIGYIK